MERSLLAVVVLLVEMEWRPPRATVRGLCILRHSTTTGSFARCACVPRFFCRLLLVASNSAVQHSPQNSSCRHGSSRVLAGWCRQTTHVTDAAVAAAAGAAMRTNRRLRWWMVPSSVC